MKKCTNCGKLHGPKVDICDKCGSMALIPYNPASEKPKKENKGKTPEAKKDAPEGAENKSDDTSEVKEEPEVKKETAKEKKARLKAEKEAKKDK